MAAKLRKSAQSAAPSPDGPASVLHAVLVDAVASRGQIQMMVIVSDLRGKKPFHECTPATQVMFREMAQKLGF